MKSWMIAVVVVVVLAVGGGAFYGGMKFRESQLKKDPTALLSLMGGRQGNQGTFMRQGNAQFPGAPSDGQSGTTGTGQTGQARGGTMGTIESIEGNVVTIKTNDNKSVKVQTSDTTLVEKFSSVSVSDLEVGESIIVSGSTNDDGSITARSIQSMRGMTYMTDDQSSSN